VSFKVKVKLSLCLTKHYAMKKYWGSGDIAPRILGRSKQQSKCSPSALYLVGLYAHLLQKNYVLERVNRVTDTCHTVQNFHYFILFRLGIFLFATASRPALGPTQHPIQ
jgi:hypothetical protein